MKIAHAAEGFGLDAEPHGPRAEPAPLYGRHPELQLLRDGLVHPKVPTFGPPVYVEGYRDELDSIDKNGCVQPPEGPGMGVTLDWDYIEKHKTDRAEYT